ncbi:hypothetical protein CDAR_576441 [Caerostris darwini]|uniref:Uncharacterized protein n=1 Tax=Caerostris darwini TaxID=1538125 RepID=A0AAV4TKQ9_9ARAC|nr:hypothetical protein CDAR_576441 [Caerostris darwini]
MDKPQQRAFRPSTHSSFDSPAGKTRSGKAPRAKLVQCLQNGSEDRKVSGRPAPFSFLHRIVPHSKEIPRGQVTEKMPMVNEWRRHSAQRNGPTVNAYKPYLFSTSFALKSESNYLCTRKNWKACEEFHAISVINVLH